MLYYYIYMSCGMRDATVVARGHRRVIKPARADKLLNIFLIRM